ncbi:hypothetical protein [Flavobacterium cerinum]|uniref:Uncharacterized protein n=1 Tax=Flavobacterium cerinum TaxID=2502784 RepID=A0A3S3Q8D4_9FLAO|nr:hypothetical protein [Flavobacterium cerinum]RWW99647.1 hypothetical protein EPI11_11900 [Flavobacterium cerinum]
MKTFLKIGLLSLVVMVVSCKKEEQNLSIHNASSKGFYFLTKNKLEGGIAIMSLRGDEDLMLANGNKEFSKAITDEFLDKFKVNNNYVFYMVNKDDLAMPLMELKAAKMYDSIVIPAGNDITNVDLYVKDTIGGKLSLSSRVKSVTSPF